MEYFKVLWAYLLVSAPYLLFGLLISGAIHQLVPMEKVKKWLGANKLSAVIKASLVGIPLPLCSCSVIPTAVTLRKGGASNAATSSFLISTPESGVDSMAITYALIDLPMTILRPVAAFFSAFVAGILQFNFNKFEYQEESEPVKSCCKSKGKASTPTTGIFGHIQGVFKYGYGKLSDDIAFWLTIGLLAGALIDFVVPDDFFSDMGMMGNRLIILAIGVPLYICASASTPIAVSLMLKGLSPGSALLLLLVGPATNVSNIAVLQKYIGKKGVLLNIASIVGVALIFSFLTDYLYQDFIQLRLSEVLESHDHQGQWWQVISAVLLVLLLVKGVYKDKVRPMLKK